jgi:hypothetical protein
MSQPPAPATEDLEFGKIVLENGLSSFEYSDAGGGDRRTPPPRFPDRGRGHGRGDGVPHWKELLVRIIGLILAFGAGALIGKLTDTHARGNAQ